MMIIIMMMMSGSSKSSRIIFNDKEHEDEGVPKLSVTCTCLYRGDPVLHSSQL